MLSPLVQVDSVAASLTAVGNWLRDGAKLAVLGVLGLGLVPLLVGAFMELAVVPLRCASAQRPDWALHEAVQIAGLSPLVTLMGDCIAVAGL